LEDGIYSDVLKIAKVIPLHKGGTKFKMENYRPRSLIYKIFGNHTTSKTNGILGKYNLFTNCQFGFRKQHSTKLAITYLNKMILEQGENNNYVCGIFIDFAKAFNCVNHQILINKLQHYGVRGIVLKLFSSYLSNRHQYTVNNVENISSTQLPTGISIGVPQGSVVGLFCDVTVTNLDRF